MKKLEKIGKLLCLQRRKNLLFSAINQPFLFCSAIFEQLVSKLHGYWQHVK